MTKNQTQALAFAVRNPGWQSFAQDRTTRGAINALANRCLVELSKTTGQFRVTEKGIRELAKIREKQGAGNGPESVRSLFAF